MAFGDWRLRFQWQPCNLQVDQGRSDGGGYRYLYPPPRKKISPSKLFMGQKWRQNGYSSFRPPKKLSYPQNKFLATPLKLTLLFSCVSRWLTMRMLSYIAHAIHCLPHAYVHLSGLWIYTMCPMSISLSTFYNRPTTRPSLLQFQPLISLLLKLVHGSHCICP